MWLWFEFDGIRYRISDSIYRSEEKYQEHKSNSISLAASASPPVFVMEPLTAALLLFPLGRIVVGKLV